MDASLRWHDGSGTRAPRLNVHRGTRCRPRPTFLLARNESRFMLALPRLRRETSASARVGPVRRPFGSAGSLGSSHHALGLPAESVAPPYTFIWQTGSAEHARSFARRLKETVNGFTYEKV